MIRKTLSVTTVGLVDFRSAKDRTAAHTRGAKRHARRQVAEARKQTKLMRATTKQQPLTPAVVRPQLPPAGWYADPAGGPTVRWWDGTKYTGHTQPL